MKRVLAGLVLVATTTLAVAAGETTTMKYDLGTENPKWTFVAGQWVRRPSGGRQVLAQTVETQPWAVALLEDKKFGDVDVSVRFRPVSGREDASGGIIFRAKDGQNYLLVRGNALENNFRLYTIVNGKRSTIASARVNEPKLGEWHTIRLVVSGPKVEAYLDGARLLNHDDKTFTEGWVGLWTKADSVTEFGHPAADGARLLVDGDGRRDIWRGFVAPGATRPAAGYDVAELRVYAFASHEAGGEGVL